MSDGLHKEYGSGQYRMCRNLQEAFGSRSLDTPSGDLVRTRAGMISFQPARRIHDEPFWMAILGGVAFACVLALMFCLAI